MDTFFNDDQSNATDITKNKSTKRKRPIVEIDPETKQKAELYCNSAEQWCIVKKYSRERLQDFCSQHEFNEKSKLNETVFCFIQRAIGIGADTLGFGDGYIKAEIENDLSLKKAIQNEAGNFLHLLSNRFKIFSLLSIDIMNGKLNQRRDNPPEIEIEEIINEQPGQREPGTTDDIADVVQQEVIPEEDREVPGVDCG